MKKYFLIITLFILTISFSDAVRSEIFTREGIETHVSAGGALFAPWNIGSVGYGYDIGLVLRPSYARYLYDELEKWNLGIAIRASVQEIPSGNAFNDAYLTLRYYFNRGEFGPLWQSGFVGAGAGIATVRWDNNRGTNEGSSNVYLLEAGYEMDMPLPLDIPMVLMFGLNCRIIDAESVSYSGFGVSFNICYGVKD